MRGIPQEIYYFKNPPTIGVITSSYIWLTSEVYRWIHADVIVYIFAHFHTTLRTEGNMLHVDTN